MKTFFSILALILILAAACNAAQQTTIMVRPNSEVAPEKVMLADIATIQCADKALSEKLADTEICSSPLPGKTRKLMKQQIVTALRRIGVGDDSYSLLCPPELTILRSASIVSGEALFEAAKQFALSDSSLPGTVMVEPGRIQTEQSVPAGQMELRVKPGTKEVRKGQNSVPVEIVIDGKVYRTVSVGIMVKVLAPVLISTQTIARLREISSVNTVLEQRDITMLPSDFVLDQPTGNWVAAVPIQQGAMIRRSWISEPLAVKSGDAVLVVVESGTAKVTEKGTAVQDGRPGDVIKVRFTGDMREIRAKVSGPGIVAISINRGNQK